MNFFAYMLFYFVFAFLFFVDVKTEEDKYVNEFVVQIPNGYSEAKSVALQMGFHFDHKMIGFDDLYVFKHRSSRDEKLKFHGHRLKRSPKVTWVEQQMARKRVKRAMTSKRLNFIDPLYPDQWYLIRSLNNPKDVDMNVMEAWQLGYTGKNIVISILDDGIDYNHPDLKENYDAQASYDINGRDNDPLPNVNNIDNRHGTRCAGEVSARANNNVCGVGVAYNSKIGAVRMLDGEVTDRVEAEALSLRQQHIDIYSGSWGPDDNGEKVEGPATLAKSAFEKGTKTGRNGLGNIYVWASGNGGHRQDSCACDGYASSIYTLSVSSVSEFNRKPWYLESCASTIATTYSSGGGNERKIISTDLNGKCANDHTGTSASAPLAAGIIALLLEANRNLTWRDVQFITILTANTEPFVDANFIINGANRKVSNLYGFGLMDSGKMVRLGRLWHTVPSQHICKSNKKLVKRVLRGIFKEKASIKINGCISKNKVNFVEHVVLYVQAEYQKRGALRIYLISPSGTRSEILPYRVYDAFSGSTLFDKWPLMSVQFWGEQAAGEWTVEIENENSRTINLSGLWMSFWLEIYGTDKLPIRLKQRLPDDPDDWFQQFERYVVENVSDVHNVELAKSRGHTDTSNRAFELAHLKCDDECFNNTCSGYGPQYCVSCKNYVTVKGVCVSKCPPGTYLEKISKICEPCHFSCNECKGPGIYNCSRCHEFDSFIRSKSQCNMSLQGCPRAYFKDSNSCNKCPQDCIACFSATHCSVCNKDYVLTLNFQCRQKCDIGSYPDLNNKCRVCHTDCIDCIGGSSTSCISCREGSLILSSYQDKISGACVENCPLGYYFNKSDSRCRRCHFICKTCNGPTENFCTDCLPPLELSESVHTCIDPVSYNCMPRQYMNSIGFCTNCSSDCQTCSSNQCTSCSLDKRILFRGLCMTNCPLGYVAAGNTCLPCHLYCPKNQNEVNLCHSCVNVKQTCENRKFWNSTINACQKCHVSCESCIGPSKMDCIKCAIETHVLSNSTCLDKCPFGTYSLMMDFRRICVSCHPACNNSVCDSETGKCLSCAKGHQRSKDGFCQRIITCPLHQYWSLTKQDCQICNASCRSCINQNDCTSCVLGSCLHPKYSTCHSCCSSQYSKDCFSCYPDRELCIIESVDMQNRPLIFIYPKTVIFTLILIFVFIFCFIMFLFNYNDVSAFCLSGICWRRTYSIKYEALNRQRILSDDSSDSEIDFIHLTLEKTLKSSGDAFIEPISNKGSDESSGVGSSPVSPTLNVLTEKTINT